MKIKTLSFIFLIHFLIFQTAHSQKVAYTKDLQINSVLHYDVDTLNQMHQFYTLSKVKEGNVEVLKYIYDKDFENLDEQKEILSFAAAKEKYPWWKFTTEQRSNKYFDREYDPNSIYFKSYDETFDYNWDLLKYERARIENVLDGYPYPGKNKTKQYKKCYYEEYSKNNDCMYTILQREVSLDLVKVARDMTYQKRPLNCNLYYPLYNKVIMNEENTDIYVVSVRNNKKIISKDIEGLSKMGCFVVLFDKDLKVKREVEFDVSKEEALNVTMERIGDVIIVYTRDAFYTFDLDLNLIEKTQKDLSYYSYFTKPLNGEIRLEVNSTYSKQYVCLYDNNDQLISNCEIPERMGFVSPIKVNNKDYLLIGSYSTTKMGVNEAHYRLIEYSESKVSIIKTINNSEIQIPTADFANNPLFKSNRFYMDKLLPTNKIASKSGGVFVCNFVKTSLSHYFPRTLYIDEQLNLSLYEVYGYYYFKNYINQNVYENGDDIFWVTVATKGISEKGENLHPKVLCIDRKTKEIKNKLYLNTFNTHKELPILHSFDKNTAILFSPDYKVCKLSLE